ncbi:MAG: Rrf2 family transcriptional regulator [Solirubrobacterales bacterium]|nr:Rrf2 family transcriptional regulator [Solirubrobacterales bacterium]
MTVCRSPGCAEPGTVEGKFARWCDEHAAIFQRVAAEIGERPKRTKKLSPTRSKAGRAKLDEGNARKIADAVSAADEPLSGVAELIGVGTNSIAYKNAIALAKSRGWIAVRPGRGFIPGPSAVSAGPPPRRNRALELARAVQAAEEPLGAAEAAEAMGMSMGGLKKIARQATNAGWIESKRGPGGGYIAASDAPPVE